MTDFDSEEDSKLRGLAVGMFSQLERALDRIIRSYYTSEDHPHSFHFCLDVLLAEGFSYSLRRDIFESILRRHDLFGSRFQHLHASGRWRNFLVHVAGVEVVSYVSDGENLVLQKSGLRDSKRPYKVVTVSEAFQTFKLECEAAISYCLEASEKISVLDP